MKTIPISDHCIINRYSGFTNFCWYKFSWIGWKCDILWLISSFCYLSMKCTTIHSHSRDANFRGLAKMWYSLTFYFVVFFTCQWSAQPFSLKVCMHNSIWLILRYSLKPGQGSSWSWLYGSWIYNYQYLCNQCLSPLMLWVRISIMARCTSLCDKVCQWPPTGRWFSPGPPVSFVNKTDCHDITEILLKVVLNIIKQ